VSTAAKVYDFKMEKVQGELVSFLKRRRGESTVADMIAGTGLPKYQVEQAARSVLDEYAGRLKVTESGELLYYFPSGMRSTTRGTGPAFRKFMKAFAKGAAKVLAFLFKIWIVVMLVGYFVAFVAILLAAILASFAASAASKNERGRGGRSSGGGFGGTFLFMRLLDTALRMWFVSNLMRDTKRPPGRPFYKSVFAFVFGEGDPNADWEERERKYALAYIRGRRGVITIEELMTLTGKEYDEAQRLINRYMVEFEGEPGVTDDGTLVFAFPELLRTSEAEQKSAAAVPVLNPTGKKLIAFSANKPKTNGWIAFFNAFNLAFGSYFLLVSLLQGAAALGRGGPMVYSFTGRLLQTIGISSPVAFLAVVLGAVPIAFSLLFFLVPIVRKARLDRANARIREEALRKRVYARVLANPGSVRPDDIPPVEAAIDPKGFAAVRKRILDRFAALKKAEPILQEKDGSFSYRFAELERELADLERYRRSVDLRKLEVGKTVFDSGQ
jgi:hypothetical protein